MYTLYLWRQISCVRIREKKYYSEACAETPSLYNICCFAATAGKLLPPALSQQHLRHSSQWKHSAGGDNFTLSWLSLVGMWCKHCHLIVCQKPGESPPQSCRCCTCWVLKLNQATLHCSKCQVGVTKCFLPKLTEKHCNIIWEKCTCVYKLRRVCHAKTP